MLTHFLAKFDVVKFCCDFNQKFFDQDRQYFRNYMIENKKQKQIIKQQQKEIKSIFLDSI